jgi:hypothetical protein
LIKERFVTLVKEVFRLDIATLIDV